MTDGGAFGGDIVAAFWTWYNGARTRFAVPLRLVDQDWDRVILEFLTPEPCLGVSIGRWGLSVHVLHPGDPEDSWDIVLDLDAHPVEDNGRWVCELCVSNTQPDKPPIRMYRSRQALLEDHVFEEFLAWVNARLSRAEAVGLYSSDGCTWAKLLPPDRPESAHEADCLVRRIPLRG